MARGFGRMPANMSSMMKQVEKMQKEMEKSQEELEKKIIESSSGGGAVKVKINGKKELIDLFIDEDLINLEESDMLKDLIITCVNSAIKDVEEMQNKEMSKLTGGLNIPGLG